MRRVLPASVAVPLAVVVSCAGITGLAMASPPIDGAGVKQVHPIAMSAAPYVCVSLRVMASNTDVCTRPILYGIPSTTTLRSK